MTSVKTRVYARKEPTVRTNLEAMSVKVWSPLSTHMHRTCTMYMYVHVYVKHIQVQCMYMYYVKHIQCTCTMYAHVHAFSLSLSLTHTHIPPHTPTLTTPTLTACHISCKLECLGPGASGCVECRNGYSKENEACAG